MVFIFDARFNKYLRQNSFCFYDFTPTLLCIRVLKKKLHKDKICGICANQNSFLSARPLGKGCYNIMFMLYNDSRKDKIQFALNKNNPNNKQTKINL